MCSLASANGDRKSTRLNSSHVEISYAVFCWKKKTFENRSVDFAFRQRKVEETDGFVCANCGLALLLDERLVMLFFFFTAAASTEIYTLSLHDALPISRPVRLWQGELDVDLAVVPVRRRRVVRSEEHTSELQSRRDLVCRLLLEKKKKKKKNTVSHNTQQSQKK